MPCVSLQVHHHHARVWTSATTEPIYALSMMIWTSVASEGNEGNVVRKGMIHHDDEPIQVRAEVSLDLDLLFELTLAITGAVSAD